MGYQHVLEMKQLLQYLGNGRTVLVDVPAPGPRSRALLIASTRSLISAGTERMLVDFSKAGWIGKARQQPEKVRAIINKVRSNGLIETVRAVSAKLQQPIPLGYCQVGRVVDGWGSVEDGDQIEVDDRVVSNGPHAEVVSVSHDLCAWIPEGVSDEAACFTPLGAIALEGINLLGAGPGDKVVVTGLGLIGQLAVRIFKTIGCEVLGLDPEPDRRRLAEQCGAQTAAGDPVTAALAWTGGKGVAGVLITASTSSNEIVSQAARSCRRRGKVVLVGVVGLHLNRSDFYRNEVSFQVSCSYGSRDARERNSARSNFEQVLAWMAQDRLQVEDLITHRFAFETAATAYTALADRQALGVLMIYDRRTEDVLEPTVVLRRSAEGESKPDLGHGSGVALIGAGNFATRTLLPAMMKLADRPRVVAVASRQGAPALLAAQACGAERATTDVAGVFADPTVTAVFITTRHDAHAEQAQAALRAGKHVWVEKPLCLRIDELKEVESAIQSAAVRHPSSAVRPPILMVGFNRRFAPMAVELRKALASRPGAHRFTMTVNAGRLEPDHWTLDSRAGGGRIVGEACHFVDLMRYLAGTPIRNVRCLRRDTDGQDGAAFELEFDGGTKGLIDYRTDLAPHLPKEIIEVTGDGFTARITNWAQLRSAGLGGLRQGGFWNRRPRKGHPEALQAFFAAVHGAPAPIPLGEILEVSRWSLAMQAMPAPDTIS